MSSVRRHSFTSPPGTPHSIQSSAVKPSETDPLLPEKSDKSSENEVIVKKTRVTGEAVKNVMTAVCLWLGYLVVTSAYSLFGPFFPSEAADKGASPTMVGVIIGSSPLCVVFLAPVFGYLLPRLGLRFTLLAGLWLVGGAFILLGFTSSPQISSGWMFVTFCILLRMTEGVGSAMFFTAAFAVLPELFPNHVGTVMGLFEVAAGLGMAIGPPVGGVLYEAGGFSLPFQVMGGLSLLFVIPCFLLVKGSECKGQPSSWKILKTLGSNFIIILLLVANALAIAAISFLTPTLQPFLQQYFNLDPVHIGFVFLSGPLAYMVFAVIIGPLSDKLGHRGFVLAGQLIYSVCFIFIGPPDFISSPQLWITVIAFVAVGTGAAFGMIPIYADLLHLAKKISPDDVDSEALTSVLSGVVSSTLSFGEFMGPLVSGALAQYFDFQTSAVLFGEVVFAMGILLIGVTIIDRALSPRKDHKLDTVN